MFFLKKNKKVKIKTLLLEVETRNFKSEYVEIKELATQFSKLGVLAHEINDIDRKNKSNPSALFFYQTDIRQAFIEEFEQRLEELLGRKLLFDDYWKTRSC